MTIPTGLPAELADRWVALERKSNSSDLEWARLATQVLEACEGDVARMVALLETFDVPAKTTHKRCQMAAALDVFPDEKIWLAIGWSGILRLLAISDPKDRDSAARALLEKSAARGGSRIGFVARQSVISRFLPKSPATPEPKPGGPPRARALAAILERLIRAFPRAIELLDDEEKRLLGLDAPAALEQVR